MMHRAILALAAALLLAACPDDPIDPAGDTSIGDADATPDVTAATDTATSTSPTDTAGDADGDGVTGPETVDWAILQHPSEHTGEAGAELAVYGRVYEAGRTDSPGAAAGIEAQAGVGKAADALEAWTWVGGTFNVDVDEGANDEHVAVLTLPEAGTWRYAWRFRVDGGPWVYADRAGTDDGFDVLDAGLLTVVAPTADRVDWCILQFPAALEAAPNAPVGDIFGRVYEAGVTDQGDDSAQIVGQLGFGDPASDVADDWTWAPATFHAAAGNDDEYTGTFAAPATPDTEWAYAFRFRLASNAEWTYCDLDGTDDGFDVEAAGVLTVVVPDAPAPDWAIVRPATLSWPVNGAAPAIEVVVFEAGVTVGAGAGADVAVEVGTGPAGTDPRSDDGWTFAAATWSHDEDGLGSLDNDVWTATPAVTAEGPFAYAARVSVDGGVHWSWVDADGLANGFDPGALGAGEVLPHATARVDWCRLREPATVTVAPGGGAEFRAEVFEDGLTQGGNHDGISAAVGQGPRGTSPENASWSWVAAAFEADFGANDLYVGTLAAPAVEGTVDVAFRFRLGGEGAWLYCDRDGSDSGYDPAQSGRLVTAASPPPEVDFGVVVTESLTVEGCDTLGSVDVDVYEPSVTSAPGKGAGLLVQGGHGPAGSDPSEDGDAWAFSGASYVADVEGGGNPIANDRYRWTAPRVAPGTYAIAARASLDAGATWRYFDADAGTAAYDPTEAAVYTVGEPGGVCYARVMNEGAPRVVGVSRVFEVPVELWSGGVTDAAGQGAGFDVQVGYATTYVDPDTAPGSWSWVVATYAGDIDGDYPLAHDVYRGAVPAPASEVDALWVAGRARYEGGAWVYIDGSPDAALRADAFHVVRVEDPLEVDFCRTQFPLEATATTGGSTGDLYGQVWEPGVTGVGGHPLPAVRAQVGYGPDGTTPSGASWRWVDAPFFGHRDNGFGEVVNDEHKGALTPVAAGTYDIAWRFSLDGGDSWRYCDAAGSDVYDPADAASLIVTAP